MVVKPKIINLNWADTLKTINDKIDSDSVSFHNIRKAANRGVIIECQSINETEIVKNIAQSKLGDDFIVSSPSSKTQWLK